MKNSTWNAVFEKLYQNETSRGFELQQVIKNNPKFKIGGGAKKQHLKKAICKKATFKKAICKKATQKKQHFNKSNTILF